MALELLRSSSHVHIYYDSSNEWLFVDWQGELDVPAVQLGCLELAYTCLHRPYRRVLASTMQLTGVAWDVPAWLAKEFMPYLALAGVEQLACVSGNSTRGRDVLQDLVNRMPPLPIIVFDDLEMAVDWLQRTRPTRGATAGTPNRLPATETKLHEAVMRFMRLVQLRRTQIA